MVEWPGTKRKETVLTRITGFEMGGIRFGSMPVLFAELPAPLSVPLIGKDLLSCFTLVINYSYDELLLVPRGGMKVKENEFSFGVSLLERIERHLSERPLRRFASGPGRNPDGRRNNRNRRRAGRRGSPEPDPESSKRRSGDLP